MHILLNQIKIRVFVVEIYKSKSFCSFNFYHSNVGHDKSAILLGRIIQMRCMSVQTTDNTFFLQLTIEKWKLENFEIRHYPFSDK